MLRPCCTTLSCGNDALSSSNVLAVAWLEPSATKTISAEFSEPMANAISRDSGAMFSASSLTGTTTERATCMLMFRSTPSYNKLPGREANPKFLGRRFGPWRRGARALYRPGPKSNRAVSRRRISPAFLVQISSYRAGYSKAVPDDRCRPLRLHAPVAPAGPVALAPLPRSVASRRAVAAGARPRRKPLRAGLQADDRDGRFRRHPLLDGHALQQARRHLLAADGLDKASGLRREESHLDLSRAVVDRRLSRRVAGLLVRKRVCERGDSACRGGVAGRECIAHSGNADRDDGCRAARSHTGRTGGAVSTLFVGARSGAATCVTRNHSSRLVCVRRRRAGERPGDPGHDRCDGACDLAMGSRLALAEDNACVV